MINIKDIGVINIEDIGKVKYIGKIKYIEKDFLIETRELKRERIRELRFRRRFQIWDI